MDRVARALTDEEIEVPGAALRESAPSSGGHGEAGTGHEPRPGELRGSRRDLLKLAGGVAVAGLLPGRAGARRASPASWWSGAGFGGATCARYLRAPRAGGRRHAGRTRRGASSPVRSATLVIAGLRNLDSVTHGFEGLRRRERHRAGGGGGRRSMRRAARSASRAAIRCPYDRLVLSPGIDLKWNAIDGYDEAAASAHAACVEGGAADRRSSGASSRPWRTGASW